MDSPLDDFPSEAPERIDRVERSIAIQVWTPELQWQMRSARLVSMDKPRDLAVLSFDAPAAPALRLSAVEVREGAAIALIGGVGGGLLFLAVFWRPAREPAR